VNKTTASDAHLAKCVIHVQLLVSSCARTNKNLIQLFMKILKKLRTASLNSEFIGSYKKVQKQWRWSWGCRSFGQK